MGVVWHNLVTVAVIRTVPGILHEITNMIVALRKRAGKPDA
jgi:hypothetical protein